MKLKSAEVETVETTVARKFVGSTLVILRREHLAAMYIAAPGAKKMLLYLGAKIINLLLHWGDWKIPLYPSPRNEWIYLTQEQIVEELLGEPSIHSVRETMELLEQVEIIDVSRNWKCMNGRNGQTRTYQYRLNRERLKQLIAQAEPKPEQEAQSLAASEIFKSEAQNFNFRYPSFNPQDRRFTVEEYTQIPSPDSSTDSFSPKKARVKFKVKNVATKTPPTISTVTTDDIVCYIDENSDKQEETSLKQQTSHEGQFSAAPRGFTSIEERDNFYLEVLELAKHKSGVKSPVSWTGAIMQSIAKGEPCIYLDEFRRGEKVGTCEKQEWEIAPGRPYDNFVTYLRRKLQPNYATIEQATQAAFKSIADVNQARILWNDYKNHLINLEQEWEKQKALGVTTPYIPAEVLPQKEVSVEQAAAAIANLVQASAVNAIAPEQTASPEKAIATQETVSEEPAVVLEEAVSEEPGVTAQETVTEESAVIPEETEAEVERRIEVLGLINNQNKLLKYPAGLGFVKMWVQQNSDLVQFNEDGIVVAIDGEQDEQQDVTEKAASGTPTSNTQTDGSSTPDKEPESTENNYIEVGDYVFVNSCPHTDKFAPFEVLEIDGEFAQIEMFPYPVRISDLRLDF